MLILNWLNWSWSICQVYSVFHISCENIDVLTWVIVKILLLDLEVIQVFPFVEVWGHPGKYLRSQWLLLLNWRRKWQPTPVLLPEESHGQRSLVCYSPWGDKESDMTEWLHLHFHFGLHPWTLPTVAWIWTSIPLRFSWPEWMSFPHSISALNTEEIKLFPMQHFIAKLWQVFFFSYTLSVVPDLKNIGF